MQNCALDSEVGYLNDIRGFPDESQYPRLADSATKLIVMHSVSQDVLARRTKVSSDQIVGRVIDFFDQRIDRLTKAGVPKERIIIDPGMGFFLGVEPENSLTVLRHIQQLKQRWELPILVSVSRKSFLQRIAEDSVHRIQPATLAAEIHCLDIGVDYIRTHEPLPLKQAATVWEKIRVVGTTKE